jgi:hypothetical protein
VVWKVGNGHGGQRRLGSSGILPDDFKTGVGLGERRLRLEAWGFEVNVVQTADSIAGLPLYMCVPTGEDANVPRMKTSPH